jgi:hypothetical protein
MPGFCERKDPPDRSAQDVFFAVIAPGSCLDLGDPITSRDGGDVADKGVLNDAVVISGRAQAAVNTRHPKYACQYLTGPSATQYFPKHRCSTRLPIFHFVDAHVSPPEFSQFHL